MMTPGSPIRHTLAVAWCVLVGTAFLLTQMQALNGAPVTLHDGLQLRLQAAYSGFLIITAIILMSDLFRWWVSAHPRRPLHEP